MNTLHINTHASGISGRQSPSPSPSYSPLSSITSIEELLMNMTSCSASQARRALRRSHFDSNAAAELLFVELEQERQHELDSLQLRQQQAEEKRARRARAQTRAVVQQRLFALGQRDPSSTSHLLRYDTVLQMRQADGAALYVHFAADGVTLVPQAALASKISSPSLKHTRTPSSSPMAALQLATVGRPTLPCSSSFNLSTESLASSLSSMSVSHPAPAGLASHSLNETTLSQSQISRSLLDAQTLPNKAPITLSSFSTDSMHSASNLASVPASPQLAKVAEKTFSYRPRTFSSPRKGSGASGQFSPSRFALPAHRLHEITLRRLRLEDDDESFDHGSVDEKMYVPQDQEFVLFGDDVLLETCERFLVAAEADGYLSCNRSRPLEPSMRFIIQSPASELPHVMKSSHSPSLFDDLSSTSAISSDSSNITLSYASLICDEQQRIRPVQRANDLASSCQPISQLAPLQFVSASTSGLMFADEAVDRRVKVNTNESNLTGSSIFVLSTLHPSSTIMMAMPLMRARTFSNALLSTEDMIAVPAPSVAMPLSSSAQRLWQLLKLNFRVAAARSVNDELREREFVLHSRTQQSKLHTSSDERLCLICYEHESSVVLLDCGHKCLCQSCSLELISVSAVAEPEVTVDRSCPVCRMPVSLHVIICAS